jgi:hypothetical protein
MNSYRARSFVSPSTDSLGSPQPRALMYKEGYNSQFVNPPNDLQQLADAIETKDTSNDSCDFSLVFVENKSDLLLYFLESMECSKFGNLFWLAYPKKSGKIESDLSRDIIWRVIEEYGYRPVSMVSIDDTWSAMRVRPSYEVG